MSQLVLKSLSILLGIFFIFLGIIKVTGYIDKDLHKDQVRVFGGGILNVMLDEVLIVCDFL